MSRSGAGALLGGGGRVSGRQAAGRRVSGRQARAAVRASGRLARGRGRRRAELERERARSARDRLRRLRVEIVGVPWTMTFSGPSLKSSGSFTFS
jgi:hypothetical protein